MAESMHNSSDIPNFDTYPSTPPDRLLDTKSAERSSLEERAAELGAAAGRIALILRQTKENVENLAQHEIYDRVTNLAENAKIRTENMRRMAADRVQELTHAAQDKAAELGTQAREKTAELGRQAQNQLFPRPPEGQADGAGIPGGNGAGGWGSRAVGGRGTKNREGETCILRNQLQPSWLRPRTN